MPSSDSTLPRPNITVSNQEERYEMFVVFCPYFYHRSWRVIAEALTPQRPTAQPIHLGSRSVPRASSFVSPSPPFIRRGGFVIVIHAHSSNDPEFMPESLLHVLASLRITLGPGQDRDCFVSDRSSSLVRVWRLFPLRTARGQPHQ